MDAQGSEISRVLRCLKEASDPLSLAEIAQKSGITDTGTVSRYIKNAVQQGYLIHKYNDVDQDGNITSRFKLDSNPDEPPAINPHRKFKSLLNEASLKAVPTDVAPTSAEPAQPVTNASDADVKSQNKPQPQMKFSRTDSRRSRRSSRSSNDEEEDCSSGDENERRPSIDDSERALWLMASQYPTLSVEAENSLAREAHDGNKLAVVKLEKHYSKKIANLVAKYPVQIRADLAQEARIALLTAIKLYDVNAKVNFAVLANSSMRHAIYQYRINLSRTIYLTLRIQAAMRKVDRAINKLRQEGMSSNDEDIAAAAEITVKEVRDAKLALWLEKILSLDRPSVEDEDDDTDIRDAETKQPEVEAEANQYRETLMELSNKYLNNNQKKVLYLKLGLGDNEPLSDAEIASLLKVTAPCVRKRFQRAIQLLRKFWPKNLPSPWAGT